MRLARCVGPRQLQRLCMVVECVAGSIWAFMPYAPVLLALSLLFPHRPNQGEE